MEFDRNDRDTLLAEDIKAFDEKLDSVSAVDVEELRQEKEALDRRYKERLEELEREKREQERIYTERIEQVKQENQYKEDLLNAQMVKLSEERSRLEASFAKKRDEILNELEQQENRIKEKAERLNERERERELEVNTKIREIQEEKTRKVEKKMEKIREIQAEIKEIEEEYEEKIANVSKNATYKNTLLKERQEIDNEVDGLKLNSDLRIKEWKEEKGAQEEIQRKRELGLRQELEECNHLLQEKITKIEGLKNEQHKDIDDKVQVLLQEKMKCDELYSLKMEKLKQDEQFRNRANDLKEQIARQELMYHEQSKDFNQKRIEREVTFKENTRNEIVTGLIKLKDMKGFRVAKGDSDVRGWSVLGINNEKLGKVDELIIDPSQMKVRYLDIKVNKDLIDNHQERHLLIPIGVAILDESDDNVLLPTLDSDMVSKLPEYSGENVTRDYERTLLAALSTDYNPDLFKDESFYQHSHFDENRFYNSRKKGTPYD